MMYLIGLALKLTPLQAEKLVPPVGAVHMSILYNGTDAGENVFSRSPDGSFISTTRLTIGALKIDSKITGHFKGSILTDYVMDQTGQGPKVKLSLSGGKVSVIVNDAKPVEVPFPSNQTTYLGSLHPAFTASALVASNWSKKEVQTIKGYLVDAGAEIPAKITPLDEKSVASGKVRRYRLQIGMADEQLSLAEDNRLVGMDVPGQKLRFVADGWQALYTDPFAKYPELSPSVHKVRKLELQRLKTRDGVELVQDVFLPEEPGRYPTVLVRTPYDRHSEEAAADFYARRGYAYVVQDCRGRTDSSGEWAPFVNEVKDGYDAVDWVSKQPWSDGNVGMIGASYGGFVQWAAAASHHPALKCIIPQVSPPLDAMRNLPYDHGIFFLYGDIWWSKVVRTKKADMSSILATLPNPKGFTTLPLSKVDDAVLGHDIPFFNEWLKKEGFAQWPGWNFYSELKTVEIPALNISGWWDGDEIGTNLNWSEMRRLGRKNQWLIYGPWTHFFNSSTNIGDTEFGSKAMLDLDTLYIRWFDTWLKHKDVGLQKIPHVQAFVMGANKWVNTPDWPAPMAEKRSLFFSAADKANGLNGKGRLLTAPPAKQAPSEYTYDPGKDKVLDSVLKVDPTKASTKITDTDKRNDRWVFKSDPFKTATAISGPLEAELHFSTSARDTDLFVSMMDIGPDGEMRVIGQGGKIRGSYVGGLDKPRPLTSGKIYVAHIPLWDTAYQFKPGHRLGVAIASTGFPMYARNLGTAEPIATATRMVVQDNKLYHDSLHPSKFTFRVLWE